jgi:uncharacterized protein YgiM (DUF1202 family)
MATIFNPTPRTGATPRSARKIARTLSAVLVLLAAAAMLALTSAVRPLNVAAASDPNSAAARAEAQIGSRQWWGMCEAFTEWTYGISGYAPDAWTMYSWLGQPNRGADPNNIPRGALIFYYPSSANGQHGHTGISQGGGRVVSSLTMGSAVGIQSTSVNYPAVYAGWSWPPSSWMTSGDHWYRTLGNVNVRSGPGTGYSVVTTLANGTSINISCQTKSNSTPYNDPVWDRISSPVVGYITDYYASTPTAYDYSPGIPRC